MLVHMAKKPKKKSAMHRATTCACLCASHAYAMHASGRSNAAGFVRFKRIYRCVSCVADREKGTSRRCHGREGGGWVNP